MAIDKFEAALKIDRPTPLYCPTWACLSGESKTRTREPAGNEDLKRSLDFLNAPSRLTAICLMRCLIERWYTGNWVRLGTSAGLAGLYCKDPNQAGADLRPTTEKAGRKSAAIG